MAVGIKLSVKINSDKIFDRLKDVLKKRPSDARIRSALDDTIEELRKATPVGATVELREGWQYRVKDDGYVIYNSKKYAKAVEKGRKPAPIPVRKPLIDWVWAKLNPSSESQARSMAFGISRNAQKNGIPGQDFAKHTLEEMRETAKSQIQRAWAEEILSSL